MSTSVRQAVADLLQPIIPAGWDIRPHTVKKVLTLSRPTVYVEYTTTEPAPEAPIGHLHDSVVVTMLSHLTDYAKAEDALDTDVRTILAALDAHDRLVWTKAEKVEVADTYLGWAITLTFISETE